MIRKSRDYVYGMWQYKPLSMKRFIWENNLKKHKWLYARKKNRQQISVHIIKLREQLSFEIINIKVNRNMCITVTSNNFLYYLLVQTA